MRIIPVILSALAFAAAGVGAYFAAGLTVSWIENSSEDFFIVKLDKIITMSETTDKKMIEVYNNYIMSDGNNIFHDEMNGKVKPSQKMGYISSVEDARNSLEKIFKDTNN